MQGRLGHEAVHHSSFAVLAPTFQYRLVREKEPP